MLPTVVQYWPWYIYKIYARITKDNHGLPTEMNYGASPFKCLKNELTYNHAMCFDEIHVAVCMCI